MQNITKKPHQINGHEYPVNHPEVKSFTGVAISQNEIFWAGFR